MAFVCQTAAFDFNNLTTTVILSGFDIGAADLTDLGRRKQRNGMTLSDADYSDRTIAFVFEITGATEAARESTYQTMIQELAPTPGSITNSLTFNPGGWPTNRTVTFYRGLSKSENTIDAKDGAIYRRVVEVTLVCQPFAKGAQVDLPRNYVVDALMWEDFDGDGVANSFTNDDSGPPTHAHTIDSGQKITITDCTGSGQIAGIYQTITDIDFGDLPSWSYGIEYKCDAATNCQYDIYVYYTDAAGGTEDYLLTARTAVNGTWTKLTLENQTIPANATAGTLVCRIKTTANDNATGALWVRKAIAIQAAAFPVGDDGVRMFWCSSAVETPASFIVENVSGDIPAETFLQAGNNGAIHIGMRSDVPAAGESLVYSQARMVTPSPQADANCMGGYYNRVTLNSSPIAAHGIYIPYYQTGAYHVITKMRSQAATPSGDAVQFGLFDIGATPLQQSTPVNFTVAQNVWEVLNLGIVNIPAAGYNNRMAAGSYDYLLSPNYTGEAGGGTNYWECDWIALVPVDSGYYIDDVETVGSLWSDAMQEVGGFWRDANTSWPPPSTSATARVITDSYAGRLIYLNPGDNIFHHAALDLTSPIAVQEAYLSVSFKPRYFL